MWLSKEQLIRWAWDTWARRRAEYVGQNESGVRIWRVHRLRHPREAEGVAGGSAEDFSLLLWGGTGREAVRVG